MEPDDTAFDHLLNAETCEGCEVCAAWEAMVNYLISIPSKGPYEEDYD